MDSGWAESGRVVQGDHAGSDRSGRGGEDVADAAFYRKGDRVRANAKMDPYAVKAWCWHVLARANEDRPKAGYKRGTVSQDFLKKVARLSWSEEGPRLAKEFLARHGIESLEDLNVIAKAKAVRRTARQQLRSLRKSL